jgi:hypothetical protein
MYEGNVIQGLIDTAEKVCKNCRKPLAEHSQVGDFCPQAWPKKMRTTRFCELGCQAPHDPRDLNTVACGKPCVTGVDDETGKPWQSDRCKEHFEE